VLEQLGLIGVRGRDQAEEEADDPVPVDGHVQRQEKDEEEVAEMPGWRRATPPSGWARSAALFFNWPAGS